MPKLVCSVNSCLHNSDNLCCKRTIEVGGENADQPSQTSCESFDDKSRESFVNKTETPNDNLEIECEAINCKYNDMRICNAKKIGIAGNGAKVASQTECATFTMR